MKQGSPEEVRFYEGVTTLLRHIERGDIVVGPGDVETVCRSTLCGMGFPKDWETNTWAMSTALSGLLTEIATGKLNVGSFGPEELAAGLCTRLEDGHSYPVELTYEQKDAILRYLRTFVVGVDIRGKFSGLFRGVTDLAGQVGVNGTDKAIHAYIEEMTPDTDRGVFELVEAHLAVRTMGSERRRNLVSKLLDLLGKVALGDADQS